MNPESSDIRSNAAGKMLFGENNRNLSQSAVEAERPDFRVFSGDREVPSGHLPMQMAGRTGRPMEASECELRFDDGAIKFIRGRAVPVFAKDGTIRGTIGVFLDVTEIRQREQQHLLELDEVKHRANNTLALVMSVANLTLKPKLEAGVWEEFASRLKIVSRTMDVVQHDGSARTIQDVIQAALERQSGRITRQVLLNGPHVVLPTAAHTALGMAIHELSTNACKYGALSTPTGVVALKWSTFHEGQIAELTWIERGGPPVRPPARKGFGTKLLTQVLGAPLGRTSQLVYAPSGVECRLYVDLTGGKLNRSRPSVSQAPTDF